MKYLIVTLLNLCVVYVTGFVIINNLESEYEPVGEIQELKVGLDSILAMQLETEENLVELQYEFEEILTRTEELESSAPSFIKEQNRRREEIILALAADSIVQALRDSVAKDMIENYQDPYEPDLVNRLSEIFGIPAFRVNEYLTESVQYFPTFDSSGTQVYLKINNVLYEKTFDDIKVDSIKKMMNDTSTFYEMIMELEKVRTSRDE